MGIYKLNIRGERVENKDSDAAQKIRTSIKELDITASIVSARNSFYNNKNKAAVNSGKQSSQWSENILVSIHDSNKKESSSTSSKQQARKTNEGRYSEMVIDHMAPERGWNMKKASPKNKAKK